MLDDKQDKTLAFINGTEEQQEKQKSEICKYCPTAGLVTPIGDEFISDWQTLKTRLQQEGYRTVVVTNLRVFSSDPDELAGILCDIMFDRRIRVEVIKKKHYKLLKPCQPENRPKELFDERCRGRALAGLKEVCNKILKGPERGTAKKM